MTSWNRCFDELWNVGSDRAIQNLGMGDHSFGIRTVAFVVDLVCPTHLSVAAGPSVLNRGQRSHFAMTSIRDISEDRNNNSYS